MPIAPRLAPALCLAACLLPAAAQALTLDDFRDALPPNPCLPVSNQPVVFTGLFCDGASCPPGTWVTCGQREVAQTGLPGVIAGTRRQVTVYTWTEESVHARVDPDNHRLQVGFEGTSEALVGIDYGTPGNPYPEPGELNLDLLALGATGFQLALDGAITPAAPLLLVVEVLANSAMAPRPSATALVVVEQPGLVFVPIGAFVPLLGFTMDDVDDIEIFVGNCLDWENGCTDAVYAPVAFTLGPIEIVTRPTPARSTSWGRLKQIYR